MRSAAVFAVLAAAVSAQTTWSSATSTTTSTLTKTVTITQCDAGVSDCPFTSTTTTPCSSAWTVPVNTTASHGPTAYVNGTGWAAPTSKSVASVGIAATAAAGAGSGVGAGSSVAAASKPTVVTTSGSSTPAAHLAVVLALVGAGIFVAA